MTGDRQTASVPDLDGFPEFDALPAIAELPDPFAGPDGTRIGTPHEWDAQRARLLRAILHYEYGPLPPASGTVTATVVRSRRLTALRASETELVLNMGPGGALAVRVIVTAPKGDGPFPVIVRGDLCWGRVKRAIASAVVKRGYILAEFDRVNVAADGPQADGIYSACPGFEGGRIAAWAWGFHRVVDWLQTLDIVDPARIAVTGHSRGGKAALLAGATDLRIALTAPNNSGCGGAGCHRLQDTGSEDIAAITTSFPYWFHRRFAQFAGHPERLPFDQHTVKALVAPRALLTTEALGDRWANPRGTQQSHAAAKEVFAFLGVPDAIGIHFRNGRHEHNAEDWAALLDFADWRFFGKSIFDQVAFPDAGRGYAWTAPRERD